MTIAFGADQHCLYYYFIIIYYINSFYHVIITSYVYFYYQATGGDNYSNFVDRGYEFIEYVRYYFMIFGMKEL